MGRAARHSRARTSWTWSIPLFLGLLFTNVFLVSPYIGWYDSGEMVGTTVCLGISHPSGQVLFHLLGKIFLLLPWGTVAFRLGLMSAVCSALASVLFFDLACRLAEKLASAKKGTIPNDLKRWMLLLTLAWSLSLPWWRYSLTPLVYALHLLLALLLIWAVRSDKPGKWFLAFFILGVATVFRPTQFFVIPFVGLAFLLEWKRLPRKTIKNLILPLPFWGLGRSTALYLPLRSALHPEMAYGELTDLKSFFHHVMALKFSKYVGAVSFNTVFEIFRQMAFHFWSDLTPLGVALLCLGFVYLLVKHGKIPVFLWIGLGWGLLEVLFVFTIPFPTFESHQILLGWVFSGLVAALGLIWIDQKMRAVLVRRLWVELILVAFLLAQFSQIGHLWDRKKEQGAEDYARNILALMEPGALYVPSEENEYFPVAGYQQSFAFRKDVDVIEPGIDPARIAPKIKMGLSQGRPLYVTRRWALPPGWGFQGWGPLLKVVPLKLSGESQKAPSIKPLAVWGGIELQGVEITPPRVHPGEMVRLVYRWVRRKASAQDDSDMIVSIFIDPQGAYWMKNDVFWLHDIHEPPAGVFTEMKKGFLYEEKRVLLVPSDFPPGNYALAVGLQKKLPTREEGRELFNREFYERNSFQNLDKFQGRGESDAVVQFRASASSSWKDGLWPVTASLYPIADPRFVPVAELRIEPTK